MTKTTTYFVISESTVYHARRDCVALGRITSWSTPRPASFDESGVLRYADDYGRMDDGTRHRVHGLRLPCKRCSP